MIDLSSATPTSITQAVDGVGRAKASLLSQGYAVCSDEDLQGFVDTMGFKPSLLMQRGQSKRLALYARESAYLEHDDFLVELVTKNRGNLGNTKVCLLIPRSTPLEYATVSASLRSGVEVYAVNSSGFEFVFGSCYGEQVKKIDQTSKESLLERLRTRRVPEALARPLKNSSHLAYSKLLRDLSRDYEQGVISNETQENDLVFAYMKRILNVIPESARVIDRIRLLKVMEEYLREGGGKMRDHFFHQFQTFLLGCVLIDSNYDIVNEWYRSILPGTKGARIDHPWLMTSLCHDLLSVFDSRGRPTEAPLSSLDHRLNYVNHPAAVLDSFFSHAREQKVDSTWDLDSHPPTRGQLCKVMVKSANEGNHGARMALQLVSEGLNHPPTILSSVICPAALAIAFHDKRVWSPLIQEQVFPIDIQRFPLAALLAYCDGVQEWGRPGKPDDQSSDHCALIDLKADSDKVVSLLYFKDKESACMTKFMHDYAKRMCMTSKAFGFEIDVYSD
jgi:hypothetical protein